ncbi:MAG: metallophosphoesterase [Dehalococcoidia bacterium]|nr:metallophosphoesterase [Dehalococcoidia bacterium]
MDGNGHQHPAEIRIAHSSDLHLGAELRRDYERLDHIMHAARAAQVDLLLLAGDIFDHNRVSLEELDLVTRTFGDAPMEVLILPGNHDCLEAKSVYRRGGIADAPNVRVLGVTDGEDAVYHGLDLTIWGRPHSEYANMSPLMDVPERKTRWQVVTAHGHWVESREDRMRSWLITPEQLDAADADYVALGHWDRNCKVEGESKAAYYSGSPDLARSFNLVRLHSLGVSVERYSLYGEGFD